MARLATWSFVLLCVASIVVVLIARLAVGPADLYEKDQPKTLAYTADVLLNGRWALPRDVIFQPATKPPLYNWIAAGVVKLTGSWGEPAMKSPSVLGAIGVGAALFFASRRLLTTSWHGRPAHDSAWQVGLLAGAIWFAYGVEPRHGSVIRLMFLARPDMLQAFFLTAAWLAATRAFLPRSMCQATADPQFQISNLKSQMAERPHPDVLPGPLLPVLPARREWGPYAILFWLSIAGAVLTKGPMALLALVYVPIAAWLFTGSFRSVKRLHPLVGIAATMLLVGSWFFFAYRTDPDHVRTVMLGAEIVGRVTDSTPEGIAKPLHYAVMWFFTKGGPFSLIAAIVAVVAFRRRRQTDPLTVAAAVWLAVLLIGLSLPAGKRIDYLLPAFAPAALLAAHGLIAACQHLRLPPALAALLPLAASLILANAHRTKFHESHLPLSDRATAFTSAIRERVRDDEPLVILVRGKHPLTTLLHRHPGSHLTPDDLRQARWIVLPLVDTLADPVLRSDLLPLGFETIDERPLALLGLYDMTGLAPPTHDDLFTAARHMADWTTTENPYRSPGTVWREEDSR